MTVADGERDWSSIGPTNPRWEPVARLAVRLGAESVPDDETVASAQMADTAARLLTEAEGNDIILREALAVFVSGADRGQIGGRAANSLRMAIRLHAQSTTQPRGLKRLIQR